MRYTFDASFARSLKRYDPTQQLEIKHGVDLFIRALAAPEGLRIGFGLTKLRSHLWEIRVGLSERVLFWRTGDEIRFTFVGNHDEVRRFLRHLR